MHRLLHHFSFIYILWRQGWPLSGLFYVAYAIERRRENQEAT